MTKAESFEAVEKWFDELNKVTNNVNKILVGNKCDLPELKITNEQARDLAGKYGAKFISASALLNKNVNEIFSTLAIGIYFYFPFIYFYNYFLSCKLFQEIYHSNLKKERKSNAHNKRKSIKIMENFDNDNKSGCC